MDCQVRYFEAQYALRLQFSLSFIIYMYLYCLFVKVYFW